MRTFIHDLSNLATQDCLKAFTDSEALDADAGFRCGACKHTCAATKRFTVSRPPAVLVLALKRFSADARPVWSTRAGSFGKNSARVRLQLEGLDLAPYCSAAAAGCGGAAARHPCGGATHSGGAGVTCSPDDLAGGGGGGGARPQRACDSNPALLYILMAVSHHSGSLDGGHYTAQCRHSSGEWNNFNDSAVAATMPSASSASAYILFYVRQQ